MPQRFHYTISVKKDTYSGYRRVCDTLFILFYKWLIYGLVIPMNASNSHSRLMIQFWERVTAFVFTCGKFKVTCIGSDIIVNHSLYTL